MEITQSGCQCREPELGLRETRVVLQPAEAAPCEVISPRSLEAQLHPPVRAVHGGPSGEPGSHGGLLWGAMGSTGVGSRTESPGPACCAVSLLDMASEAFHCLTVSSHRACSGHTEWGAHCQTGCPPQRSQAVARVLGVVSCFLSRERSRLMLQGAVAVAASLHCLYFHRSTDGMMVPGSQR